MNPKNALIYVRVSTVEQAERGVSLDNQESACHDWTFRNGVRVLKIFREEGVSAKTLKRPAIQELLAYVAKNSASVDYLVIYQIDRLSRNMDDFTDIRRLLHRYKIEIKDCSSQLEQSDSDDLVQGVWALMAEHENKLKGKRVKSNMQRHAKDGFRMHKAPYGLLNTRDRLGRPMVTAYPIISDKIACLLTEYSRGNMSKGQIVHKARDMGLTLTNGKPMSFQFVHKMLTQPLYAGLEKSSLTDGEVVASQFTGIVPEWVYYENQSRLIKNNKSYKDGYKSVNPMYPLRKFVICTDCGMPLRGSASTGNNGKRYPRYHCTTKTCRSGYVTPDTLHMQFLSLVGDMKPDAARLKLLRVLIVRVWKDEMASMRARRTKLTTTIDKLIEQRIDASESVLTGRLTVEEKTDLANRLNERIAEARSDMEKINDKLGTREENIQYALDYLDNAPKLWTDASVQTKILFQRMIFPKGLKYSLQKQEFGTPEMSSLYTLASMKKDPSKADESLLVILRRVELLLPG